MKKATQSNSKKCDHSKKLCTCGGHNIKNHKKNKKHNATKRKLAVKKTRKALPILDTELYDENA